MTTRINIRWIGPMLAVALLGCLASACSDESGPSIDSETHWLSLCDSSDDCADPYACVCGYCTEVCAEGDSCGSDDAAGQCRSISDPGLGDVCPISPPSDGGVCLPECSSSADCSDLGSDAVCRDGACVPDAISFPDFAPDDTGTGDTVPDATDVSDDAEPDDATADVAPDAPLDAVVDTNEIPDTSDDAEPDGASDITPIDAGLEVEICGTIAGLQCEDGFFCDYAENACGFADGAGTCIPRPQGCDDNVEPVCGCDGTVHSNICEARTLGHDVTTLGLCEVPEGMSACGTGFCDDSTEFCEAIERGNLTVEYSCHEVGLCDGPPCTCNATAACGGTCVEDETFRDVSCGPASDARFARAWIVDQPSHALYEATVYRLDIDNSVSQLRTVSDYGDDYVTGTVSYCFDETGPCVGCRFEGDWRSVDVNTLAIALTCNDFQQREVRLGFPTDTGGDTEGVVPTILSVDGDWGWIHNDWDWRFRACPSMADCF